MDEILELQRQLAAVQLEGTTTRLSETNCVELVTKLIAAQKIDVVFTQSGRDYLTRERLRQEIATEVAHSGGRVNTVETASLIGVDLHHVEVELQVYLEENKDTVRVINGDIITDEYFNLICEEISEFLAESGDGIIALADLATNYNLPIDVIKSMLEVRVGTKVRGKLEGGSLFTEAHIQRSKARVRGLLSGAATPIALGDVAQALRVRVQIVNEAVEDMMASGRLKGDLKGRGERALFTPKTFEQSRDDAIMSFFRANDYIETDRLRQLSVTDVKAFASKHFAKDLQLDSMIVAGNLIDQLKDSISAAVSASSWLDTMPILPSTISEEDSAALLSRVCTEEATEIVERQFVVSAQLVQDCKNLFLIDSEKKALEFVQKQPRTSAANATAAVKTEAEIIAGTTSKKGKSKRRKAKEEQAPAALATPKSLIKPPNEEEVLAILKQDAKLWNSIRQDYHGEDAEDAGFLDGLVKALSPSLDGIYSQAETRAREKVEKERAEAVRRIEKELITLLPRIEVHTRALEMITEEKLRGMLEEQLLSTLCARTHTLAFQLFSGDDQTAADIETLPSKAQKHARALKSASTSQEFLDAYDEHGPELCLPPRDPLDKKKERSLCTSIRVELSSLLKAESDPLSVLKYGSVLLFSKSKGGAVLDVSIKSVPFLVEGLRSFAKGETAEAVFALHELVVQQLKSTEGSSDGISEVSESSMSSAVEQVKQLAALV